MPRRSRSSPPAASSPSAAASARPVPSACSCRSSLFLLSFDRAEIALEQLEDPVLACGPLDLAGSFRLRIADGELERQTRARHLVAGVGEHSRVLPLLAQLALEPR